MSHTFDSICKKINWPELAKQKKVISLMEKEQRDLVFNIFNDDKILRRKAVRKAKALQALLKFIEKLQDAATDQYGISMEQVHPILTNVRLINKSKKNSN